MTDTDPSKFALAPADAAARILAHAQPLLAERVGLDKALGRWIATDVIAARDLPPWRASSMDGYAVSSADVASAGATLRVVGSIAAGARPPRTLASGEAMKIMTGAPVPQGADTVIRIEDVDAEDDSITVRVLRDVRRNVRPQGEDFSRGTAVARTGDRVTPALTGVLAAAGEDEVPVARRPRVAIVASGDELVALDAFDPARHSDRIISANSIALAAAVEREGGIALDAGIARDTPASLRDRIMHVPTCDVLLTTGGMSVGDHDHTRHVFEEIGGTIDFWRVRIRPGGPLAFGTLAGVPWIGISGNPVSALVTFELFVAPLLRRLGGARNVFPSAVEATVIESITSLAPGLTHFLRVRLDEDAAGWHASLAGTQSSGALTPLAAADALLVVPEGMTHVARGTRLRAIDLHSTRYAHRFPG